MIRDEENRLAAKARGLLAQRDASTRVICTSSITVLREASRHEVDVNALLVEAGLGADALEDPAKHEPARTQELVWRLEQQAAGDPCRASHEAERVPLGASGALELMIDSTRSLGEALSRVAQYFPRLHDTVRLEVVTTSDEVALQLTNREFAGVVQPEYAEYCFGLIASLLRLAGQSRAFAIRVELGDDSRENVAEYERVFQCRVLTGASCHRLVFSRRSWDRQLRLESPQTPALPSASNRTDQIGAHALITNVCDYLKASLSAGATSLAQAARSLGMHGRTLERRLNAMGVTFARLRDHVRRRQAEQLLETSMSLADISQELGYTEQSAFTRAFRKWTGCSPSEYRGKLAGARGPSRDDCRHVLRQCRKLSRHEERESVE
jgi:AraC-like DNA-binding protein